MTTNLFLSPPAFREGEVLIFSADSAAAQTASVLCGVSGQACESVPPRLIICDTDNETQIAAAKNAYTTGTPVLFLSRDGKMPAWEVPLSKNLPLPIRFSDFRRAVLTLLAGKTAPLSDSAPAVPRHPAIRIERGAAVSENVHVPLTPCEEKILSALTNAYPHAASAAELEYAFARHGSNSVRVYITYLRKKLTALPVYRAILPEKDGGFSLILHDGDSITNNTDKG